MNLISLIILTSSQLYNAELSEINQGLINYNTPIHLIVQRVVNFIFIVGAVVMIYMVINKKSDAREWVIAYVAGLIIWGAVYYTWIK